MHDLEKENQFHEFFIKILWFKIILKLINFGLIVLKIKSTAQLEFKQNQFVLFSFTCLKLNNRYKIFTNFFNLSDTQK